MATKTDLLCTLCFKRVVNDKHWRTNLKTHMNKVHNISGKYSAAKLKEIYTKQVPHKEESARLKQRRKVAEIKNKYFKH